MCTRGPDFTGPHSKYVLPGPVCSLLKLAILTVLAGWVTACAPHSGSVSLTGLAKDPRADKPILLWISAPEAGTLLAGEDSGTPRPEESLFRLAAEHGVDGVVAEAKPVDGRRLFADAPPRRWSQSDDAAGGDQPGWLAAVAQAARQEGLRVAAAVNLFADARAARGTGDATRLPATAPAPGPTTGDPEPGAGPWASARYTPRGVGDPAQIWTGTRSADGLFRVSPASDDAADYAMQCARALAAAEIDAILLERAGFGGADEDFSLSARRSFEAYLRRSVARWPDEVYTIGSDAVTSAAPAGSRLPLQRLESPDTLGSPSQGWTPYGDGRAAGSSSFRQPGPLFDEWHLWRARLVHDRLFALIAEVRTANPAIPVLVGAPGWYSRAHYEAINWASMDYEPAVDFRWAPPGYSRSSIAAMSDAIVLSWHYPLITMEEATAAGFTPEASIEGSAMLARRVLAGRAPVVASLYVYHFRDDPARLGAAIEMALRHADGLVLVDGRYFEQRPGLWAALAGVRRGAPAFAKSSTAMGSGPMPAR